MDLVQCYPSSSVTYSESENTPSKNFYRAGYEISNCLLEIDWLTLLEPFDIDISVNKFYETLYNVIDHNVPKLSSSPCHYPLWYSRELKELVSEKKNLHATYKESKRLKLASQISDSFEFKKVRSQCLRLSRTLYLEYISQTEF